MKISTFINHPFIYLNTSKNKWVYVFSAIIFTILFLILFQPFGLSNEFSSPINSTVNIIIFIVSISFTVFVGLTLSQFILRLLFNYNNVTIKKYIIWYIIEVSLLTLINLFISLFTPNLSNKPIEEELNFSFQIVNFFRTFIVLLFPFLGTIIYVLIKNLSSEIQQLEGEIYKFQDMYNKSNTIENRYIEIRDENNNLGLKLDLQDFLYAESSNQYVLIYYIENKEMKKTIIRTRLKTIIDCYKSFPIKQCHRSFIANLINVKGIIKKGGKMFLVMDNLKEVKLPISKSYLETIKRGVLKV